MHKRWHLTKPIKIIDENNKYLGNILDITVAGLGMVSKYPLKPDNTIKIKIDLSDEKIDLGQIELKGENVWCEERLINRYFAGIEFNDLNQDTINKIKNLIHKYGFTTNSIRA